jgi:capsid protein
LLKQSRDLADNSPIIDGLIERLVTYVIGSGLHPYAASTDPDWNVAANLRWRTFARHPDLRGQCDWTMLLAQVYRTELRDGDCGVVLTSDLEGNPKLATYEGLSIQSERQSLTVIPSTTEYDGVKLGSRGEPLAYRIIGQDGESAEWIDATNFVLVYAPRRPGQVRGVPLLASAIHTARDVQEILDLEKLAVKDASSKTDIIRTASGEVDDEQILRGDYTGQDGVQRSEYYRRVLGPEARILAPGDEYTPYVSQRPGQTWQGFMDFLSYTICLAARIPPSVLLQIKVGGADTRRDLAAAKRVFDLDQRRLTSQLTPVWHYVIASDIAAGKLTSPAEPLADPIWQVPKSITVDAGREAQQDREDVKLGLLTLEEYWAQFGEDWLDQERKNIAEMLKRKSLLAEAGLGLAEYANLRRLEIASPKNESQSTA